MKKLIGVIVCVFALLTVIVFSSQVEATEVLGCYQQNHGQLRVVSDHNECLSSEVPITLNQAVTPPVIEENCYEVVLGDGTLVGILKLIVTEIGDGHYSIRGKAYYDDLQVVLASAELEGDTFLITAIHTSKGDSMLSTGISHVEINRNTHNGTSEVIMHNLNYSDMSISTSYGTATLTNVPCPEE